MKPLKTRFRTNLAASLLALSFAAFGGAPQAHAYSAPSWQRQAVIYCIYPKIFSSAGTLAAVTAAIPRLNTLGVTVLWLMPFQPLGQTVTVAGTTHTSVGSPYSMSNLIDIDPSEGTFTDLSNLLAAAHADNMKVILDVALNQTSWDNSLVTNYPQDYYHSDNDPTNVGSIENAFNNPNYTDIAWFDIRTSNTAGEAYMESVCQFWLNQGFDGFRFDSADNPGGSGRAFPQSYAETLYNDKNGSNNLMWLGEENDSALADAPYTLDYDWAVSGISGGGGALQAAAKNGYGVDTMENAFNGLGPGGNGWPGGFQHMLMLQDWDTDEDYNTCGGFANIMPAAAFNLTMPGVPLIYNGEEVANDVGGANTHTVIDFNSANATKFSNFYHDLIATRQFYPALYNDAFSFIGNQNQSVAVCTIDRGTPGAVGECLVELNFSSINQAGSLATPTTGGTWVDISPSGSPGGTSHMLPNAPSTIRWRRTTSPFSPARRKLSPRPINRRRQSLRLRLFAIPRNTAGTSAQSGEFSASHA